MPSFLQTIRFVDGPLAGSRQEFRRTCDVGDVRSYAQHVAKDTPVPLEMLAASMQTGAPVSHWEHVADMYDVHVYTCVRRPWLRAPVYHYVGTFAAKVQLRATRVGDLPVGFEPDFDRPFVRAQEHTDATPMLSNI